PGAHQKLHRGGGPDQLPKEGGALQTAGGLAGGEDGVNPQGFTDFQGGEGVPAQVEGPVEGKPPAPAVGQGGQPLHPGQVQIPLGGEAPADQGVGPLVQQGLPLLQQQG